MRLLVVGKLNGQLSVAVKMAMNTGAKVSHVETTEAATNALRAGQGADLMMVDYALDIAGLTHSFGRRRALDDCSFTVPAGAVTALVGRNGSGKSTLVKLLCRFYDPERGAILWDGVDLREFEPAALRDRITAVFQDFVRYEMTAGENIGLGDLVHLSDDGRIRAAAQRAGIDHELAHLPVGYRTALTRIYVSESDRDDPSTGVVLSGGQWQRVAVARAFLRAQRDLTILDEPSAGLDAEAEYRIHTGLRAHRRDRTSVLISHRLGAVRDADRILVLDEGELVEDGTHASLLADGGVYATLYSLQAAGYAEAVG